MINEEVLANTTKHELPLNEQPAAPETPGKRGRPGPNLDVKGAEHFRALFDIGNDLIALEELLDETAGDVSDPAAEQAITDWMAEFEEEQAVKVDRYISLIRKKESEQAAAKIEKEHYGKIERVRSNCIARLKERMLIHLRDTNQRKIQSATGRSITIQANGGEVPLLLDFVDPAKVESRFQKVTIELNKDAVREAVKSGEEIAWAKMGVRGESLRIR